VEAVFVGSHNAGHLADVLAALARRKPVLCEKPLGLNARECARMLEAAAKSGAKLFVGHCNRYRDAVEQARGLLAAGRLGRLQSLRVWYSFLCRADAWRRDSRLSGGGPLLDLGPHLIDFARYVTGGEFEEAAAAVEPGLDAAGGQSENWARALLKLRGGTPVTMEVSFQEPLANGFELRGSAAHLRGEYCLSNVEGPLVKLELLTGDPSPMQATPLPPARREVYRLQIEEATRAILEPDFVPRCATGLDGLRVAQAIDAIYAAGRSGTREKIAAH
jgi:1,5-anhydro-D-fructose reductase (1,5-anhydro-D-mannitol-forming)